MFFSRSLLGSTLALLALGASTLAGGCGGSSTTGSSTSSGSGGSGGTTTHGTGGMGGAGGATTSNTGSAGGTTASSGSMGGAGGTTASSGSTGGAGGSTGGAGGSASASSSSSSTTASSSSSSSASSSSSSSASSSSSSSSSGSTSTGTLVWARGFGGTTDEEGNDVAVDAAGNVILGGYTTSTIDFGCGAMTAAAGDTPYLVKLSPAGACLWSKVFPLPTVGTTDQVKGVATDAAGNVYAVLTFFGSVDLGGGVLTSAGLSDVAIAKFDANGVHQWSKRYGNAGQQIGTRIATDAAGNVYVTGYFSGQLDFGTGVIQSAGNTDVFVAKLTTNGAGVWAHAYGDGNLQLGNGLHVDTQGNVLLTGAFNGTINFGTGAMTSAGLGDAYIVKLDTTGHPVWSKAVGSTGDDGGIGITSDAAGNVVAAGFYSAGAITFGGATFTNQGGNDPWVVEYDAAGNHLWSKAFGGPGNQGFQGVATDAAGNVVVIGAHDASADYGGGTLTSAGSTDILLAKFSPTGSFVWSHLWGSANVDFARGVAIDSTGDIVFTGLTNGPVDFGGSTVCGFGGEDVFLVKVTP